jgi:uncharacterized protein YcbK (DUF882 family)
MRVRTASSFLIAAATALTGTSSADPQPAAPSRTSASINYPDMVRRWHTRPPRAERAKPSDERAPLVLEMVNTSERIELLPQTDRGGFSREDMDRAAHALREPRSGEQTQMDPRILDLVYRIARHFDAPVVRVISAYRAPSNGKHSNHSRGRAIDLVVPGVSDMDVARFARTLGFVGVGLYTRSGFIHLDSRRRSYFWVDTSAPGRPDRPYHVLPALAGRADAQAVARGEEPPSATCQECENEPDPL